MIKIANKDVSASALMNAIKGGNEEEIKNAMSQFQDEIANRVAEQFEGLEQETDTKILLERGIRQLTSKEKKFYEKWIESAKSSNPKQAFTDLIDIEGMPTTVIEDVYKDLTNEHPLLSKIKFQSVGYLTEWLLNDHSANNYAWGEITSEIAAEITSGFKKIKVNQSKLSAFILIAKDMLELGPNFLDAYVRTLLKESIAIGLEHGIVRGSGVKGEIIGLNRKISKGVSINEETGYPEKMAIEVTDFRPATYGGLVAKIVKTEKGNYRKYDDLSMICNPIDYLTKIMPASTVQNLNGTYTNNIFPIPTDVIQSAAVSEGKAILFIPSDYFAGLGSSKEGAIEYSDEYKFLEDVRAYKTKLFAAGRAYDDTVAIVLDISKLEPAYITVLNKETINVTVNQEDTPSA